jgi:uncharacterized membrane protein
VRLAANLIEGHPWHEGVAQSVAAGAIVGLSLGTAAPALAAMGTTSVADAGSAVPTATNQALRRTLEALYQPSDRIPGGTAGAIRQELATHQPVGGAWHFQKGLERIANLEHIIKRQHLSAEDLATGRTELGNLRDALHGK